MGHAMNSFERTSSPLLRTDQLLERLTVDSHKQTEGQISSKTNDPSLTLPERFWQSAFDVSRDWIWYSGTTDEIDGRWLRPVFSMNFILPTDELFYDMAQWPQQCHSLGTSDLTKPYIVYLAFHKRHTLKPADCTDVATKIAAFDARIITQAITEQE